RTVPVLPEGAGQGLREGGKGAHIAGVELQGDGLAAVRPDRRDDLLGGRRVALEGQHDADPGLCKVKGSAAAEATAAAGDECDRHVVIPCCRLVSLRRRTPPRACHILRDICPILRTGGESPCPAAPVV